MRILLVYAVVNNGSSFYRLQMPHHFIEDTEKDIQIFSCDKPEELDEYSYDFVLFSRSVNLEGRTEEIISKIQKQTKVIIDIDDYWKLNENHLLYSDYKEKGISEQMETGLRMADGVICTTNYLANHIRKINNKCWVISNAVYPEKYEQFKDNRQEHGEKLRLGWLGGVCHVEDIELLYSLAQWVNNKKMPVKFCFSYNDNEVYNYYKRVITANYCNDFEPLHTKNVYEYAYDYSKFDVALAPLVYNSFNICKSELKVIEAGFHKKALIASATPPYTDILNRKNSILCRTPNDWINAVYFLLKNPDKIVELGEQLYKDVQRYHVKNTHEKRMKCYAEIAKL